MDNITKIISGLSEPKAYNHEVDDIKRIITGVSVVFLTGNFVYKLNKPLNLGFLDFSTLEKRREQCEKEVKYNSLISPELYLGVSTINKSKEGLISIDGVGKIIEYAVKMVQMDADLTMDKLLIKRLINKDHVKRISKEIFDFHKVAPMSDKISSFGSLDIIRFNWDENFDQTKCFVNEMISQEDFDIIKLKIKRFIDNNETLFEDRIKKGMIKHCHGDFHSGNIFLDGDKIIIFDGIVFNDRFPCSDVISEIAFMAMDLEFHGHIDFSNVFVKEYQNLSNDFGINNLLNFYKCYRSYIRGKIACFTSGNIELTDSEKFLEKEKARRYFKLAKNYAEIL